MNFDSTEPFTVPDELINLGMIANSKREARAEFWDEVEDYWEGLSSAIGCYVFSIDNGQSLKPWYVGQTVNNKGFKAEVFQPHKINHYMEISSGKRGTKQMSFFPLCTNGQGNLSRSISSGRPAIQWLEETLIGMALSRNPQIANIKGTMFQRNVHIAGLLGEQPKGRPEAGASFARSLFLR